MSRLSFVYTCTAFFSSLYPRIFATVIDDLSTAFLTPLPKQNQSLSEIPFVSAVMSYTQWVNKNKHVLLISISFHCCCWCYYYWCFCCICFYTFLYLVAVRISSPTICRFGLDRFRNKNKLFLLVGRCVAVVVRSYLRLPTTSERRLYHHVVLKQQHSGRVYAIQLLLLLLLVIVHFRLRHRYDNSRTFSTFYWYLVLSLIFIQ